MSYPRQLSSVESSVPSLPSSGSTPTGSEGTELQVLSSNTPSRPPSGFDTDRNPLLYTPRPTSLSPSSFHVSSFSHKCASFTFTFIGVVLCIIFLISTVAVLWHGQPVLSSVQDDMDPGYFPTQVGISKAYRTLGLNTAHWYSIKGQGPNWKTISHQDCYFVNSQLNHPYSINLLNHLDHETSIHAHGLNPPNELDGVPYMPSLPVAPNRTRLIRYPIDSPLSQTSFLLHAHYMYSGGAGASVPILSKQKVPFGYSRTEQLAQAKTVLMFLQEFCPESVERNTAHKLVVDYSKPFTCNHTQVFESLYSSSQEKKMEMNQETCKPAQRMDIVYSHFLCNGKPWDQAIVDYIDPQKPIRLVIVSGMSMSNMEIFFPPGLCVELIATDGALVHPLPITSSLWIGVGQRMEVLIAAKSIRKAVAIMAVVEALHYDEKDTPWHARGAGLILTPFARRGASIDRSKLLDTMKDRLKTSLMKLDVEMQAKPFDEQSEYTWTHADRFHVLVFDGRHGFNSMNGTSYYFYPMNANPFVPNPNPLRVKLGEMVHIVMKNWSMHPHSMHLHGHTFRVVRVNQQEQAGIWRDTVVVPACTTVTIAFRANRPGVWPLHCHMEFHSVGGGMITTVEYET